MMEYHRIKDAKEEGIEQGIETGIERGKIEVAKRLLEKNIDINIISEVTELPIEELEKYL